MSVPPVGAAGGFISSEPQASVTDSDSKAAIPIDLISSSLLVDDVLCRERSRVHRTFGTKHAPHPDAAIPFVMMLRAACNRLKLLKLQ